METETQTNVFDRAVPVLSGLAMIIAPIAQMIAFAIHPQFLTFKHETGATIQYGYIQHLGWQAGHTLVYTTLPLMLLAWIQLARLVSKSRPGVALAGAVLTWVGYGYLLGNFGMTMAMGTIGLKLPMDQALPAIQLMLENAGMMKLTFMGQIVALVGPIVTLVGLTMSPKVAPRWSGPLALLGNLIIIVFMDIDGYMIWGSFAILIALLPVAVKLLKGQQPS